MLKTGAEPHGSPYVAGPKETFGGYDCKFVEPPPSAFQTECPVCRLLLRDPYQATCCGTSFCHSCSEQVRSDNNLCPTCRKDDFMVFPNKGLKRSLNQLHVSCTHSKNGCKWRGELGELDHHLSQVIHSGKSFYCDDWARPFLPMFVLQEMVYEQVYWVKADSMKVGNMGVVKLQIVSY